MVTLRGTAQNDDTVPVAAEPAGGPRSETTLVSYPTALAPSGSVPGSTQQRPITDCAKRSAAQRYQVQRRAKRVRCNALLGRFLRYRARCWNEDFAKPRNLGLGNRPRGRRGSAGVPRAVTVPQHGESNAVRHPRCRSVACLEGSDAPRHDFAHALPDAARHERSSQQRGLRRMVTHRGTGQKDVTVHVAAEPGDL